MTGTVNPFVQLTHSNLRQPIDILAHNIFFWYYSEGHKCTIVLSVGQAAVGVLESPQQVKEAVSATLQAQKTQQSI